MSYTDLANARDAARNAEEALARDKSQDATRIAQTWIGLGNLWANIHRADNGH